MAARFGGQIRDPCNRDNLVGGGRICRKARLRADVDEKGVA